MLLIIYGEKNGVVCCVVFVCVYYMCVRIIYVCII